MSVRKRKKVKSTLDEAEAFGDFFDKTYDSDTGDKKDEIYLPIRPEGPITGAVWEKGRWIHVGAKRKRFAMEDTRSKRKNRNNEDHHARSAEEAKLFSHVNVVSNPRKRARFLMKVEQAEIEHLTRMVKREKPPRSVNPVCLIQADALKRQNETKKKKNSLSGQSDHLNNPSLSSDFSLVKSMDDALDILSSAGSYTVPEKFEELPISQYTKHELKRRGFVYLTDVQKAAIPHALVGRDILGAARTGSGKTLSFVIPVLENLYRKAWHRHLGLGALILAPTRELALQIFDTLKIVGRRLRHVSCGLLIGGKHCRIKEERKVIDQMSILIGTPGRVLNHLENSSSLNVNNLQILVLDEADHMLDIGLLSQVKKILDNLSMNIGGSIGGSKKKKNKRQTMLFSATLNPEIVKLTKMSLRRPIFIPVHCKREILPQNLLQCYVSCKLKEKLNILYTFIQTHSQDKMIVFFATQREVQFVRAVLFKLRPLSSIVCLYSQMSQSSRIDQYNRFVKIKQRGILLATELASRGLDFPNIDWVINFDVPSDMKTYIHRVGRSARLGQKGNSITFLSRELDELKFVDVMKEEYEIKLKKLGIKQGSLTGQRPVINDIRRFICLDEKFDHLARKAFYSYLSFYRAHYNPLYMDPKQLIIEDLSSMFGLQYVPEIRGDDGNAGAGSSSSSSGLASSKKGRKNVSKIRQLKDIPQELQDLMRDTVMKKKRKEQRARKQIVSEEERKHEEDDDDTGVMSEDEVSDDELTQSLKLAAKNAAMNSTLTDEYDASEVSKYQRRMIVQSGNEDSERKEGSEGNAQSGANIGDEDWFKAGLYDGYDDDDESEEDEHMPPVKKRRKMEDNEDEQGSEEGLDQAWMDSDMEGDSGNEDGESGDMDDVDLESAAMEALMNRGV